MRTDQIQNIKYKMQVQIATCTMDVFKSQLNFFLYESLLIVMMFVTKIFITACLVEA